MGIYLGRKNGYSVSEVVSKWYENVLCLFPLPSLLSMQAIEGYKETEKIKWSEASQPVIARLRREAAMAVPDKELQTLEEIHVLDLAADGQIKPHIDSVKVRRREGMGGGKRGEGGWEEGRGG